MSKLKDKIKKEFRRKGIFPEPVLEVIIDAFEESQRDTRRYFDDKLRELFVGTSVDRAKLDEVLLGIPLAPLTSEEPNNG